MSLISLWQREGKPPREQERISSVVKLAPHTHLLAFLEGVHPYLKARAYTKEPLWREKTCSFNGRAVNQFEEPFTHPRSMAIWRVGMSSSLKWLSSVVACSHLFWCISTLADIRSLRARSVYWVSPEQINFLSGAVTYREALKESSEAIKGMPIPSPPSLVGSTGTLLSFGGGRLVRFWLNSNLRMSSSTFRWSPTVGTVWV